MRRILLATSACLLIATSAQAADGISFYVGPGVLGLPYADDAAAPTCDSAGILGRISSRFAWAHAWTWHTGYKIADIHFVRESRLGGGYPSLIGRRYCEAKALISNGAPSPVYYLIETHQGFAGVGAKVTFCLPDYDPWHVYDASCRTVRPQ